MEIGYWGIKGLVESIRYLTHYLGYETTEYNPESSEDWLKTKKHFSHLQTFPFFKMAISS